MLVSVAENVSLRLSFCYIPIANTLSWCGGSECTAQGWEPDPLNDRPSLMPALSMLALMAACFEHLQIPSGTTAAADKHHRSAHSQEALPGPPLLQTTSPVLEDINTSLGEL